MCKTKAHVLYLHVSSTVSKKKKENAWDIFRESVSQAEQIVLNPESSASFIWQKVPTGDWMKVQCSEVGVPRKC